MSRHLGSERIGPVHASAQIRRGVLTFTIRADLDGGPPSVGSAS